MRTACLTAAVAIVVAGCSSSASSTPSGGSPTGGAIKAAPAKSGGSITVLEGSGYSGTWPFGLDPPTNRVGAATQDFMEAIYGQLFEQGGNGQISPDLATSYKFSPDAKTVTITLRKGVTFSDGTPFNAQAVLFNWQRDFGPLAKAAALVPQWSVDRVNQKDITSPFKSSAITVSDPYTIVVHQNQPNGAFINQLFDTIPDWIASPHSVQTMGEAQFAKTPVGAGPFMVVSDVYSNQLVVKKNPNYWDKPKPYLDQITFKTVSSDEAAYESMLAGQGQVYPDMSTPKLLDQSAQRFQVLNQLGTSPYDLQLNTASPPFNNAKARQAIYAATNFGPILQHIFENKYPVVQGFTGPGGICYQPNVAGYQGYDPTLAKQLVKDSGLDKVTFQLGTINSSPVAALTTQALQTEWKAVGIHTTIAAWNLNQLIDAFEKNQGKSWQSMIQTAGSWDPAAGVGVGFRFLSTSPFSGTHDPNLDTLLFKAQGTVDTASRCKYYGQAQSYIAKNFYGPFYFAFAPANVSVKGVGGPGLTEPLRAVAVTPIIPWEDVYYNPSGA
jgi:peptide/nickel transport system substrate-binding protein